MKGGWSGSLAAALLLSAAVYGGDFPPAPQVDALPAPPSLPAPTPIPEPLPRPKPAAEPLPSAIPEGVPLEGGLPMEGPGGPLVPAPAPLPPPPCCFYTNLELLLWQVKGTQTPPLVTTGSRNAAIPGALGMPGTAVLIGGSLDDTDRSGARFTMGYWLNDGLVWGVDSTVFFLKQRVSDFSASSPATRVLARPFFDVTRGIEDAAIIALPGTAVGSVVVSAASEVWSAEAGVRARVLSGDGPWVYALGDFRTLDLKEHLAIAQSTLTTTSVGRMRTVLEDSFSTDNQFYGGQAGATANFAWGRWSLDLRGKVAVGVTHEIAFIEGFHRVKEDSTRPRFFFGGLLAQPTNIGRFSTDDFAIVPELGFDVGYQLTHNVRLFVGYSLIYWSSVTRAADLIDVGVNPEQFLPGRLAGPARPAFTFQSTDFWMQGANFGLQIRF
jgi:hypothetical protein